MLLAKIALGIGGSVVLAGVYAFHEGALRVSVQEHRPDGAHFSLFLPAAIVPLAVHAVPRQELENAFRGDANALPLLRTLSKELKNYPNSDFVEVRDGEEHVRVRTRDGNLQIDVETPQETVHVACPLEMIDDLARELEVRSPAA
ncbi:MAG: hypothetical protein LAN71_12675 [Acidobacteriia bacterium]|nr:hypothetical protein [Terriglobia bacterium]